MPVFSKPGSMKSHDWKQLASQGILKYCLRGMLGEDPRKTLFKLLDSIQEICKETQSLDDLDEMDRKLSRALALLERDYPVYLQNITTHLLHHIIEGIKQYGPIYSTWMYVFERFNSWICKRALNKCHPENTAIETFIIFDWCQFMIWSGKASFCTMSSDYQALGALEHESENMYIYDDNVECTRKRYKITLGKRESDSIHKQLCDVTVCSNCIVEKVCQTVYCILNIQFTNKH